MAFFTMRADYFHLGNQAFSIGDMYLIAGLMSKDLQAMSGLFLIQRMDA